MREIKFRAWDGKENEMLYAEEFPIYHEFDNGLHSGKFAGNGDWYQLELMQFTGLQDKNGVDIYEGDILKITSSMATGIFNVFYFMGSFCWRFNMEATGSPLYPNLIGMTKEIIGNIHQNPELLKAGDV